VVSSFEGIGGRGVLAGWLDSRRAGEVVGGEQKYEREEGREGESLAVGGTDRRTPRTANMVGERAASAKCSFCHLS